MNTFTEHKRHDLGVIVRWELHSSNIFIVEQFRGHMRCTVCARRYCEHSRLAEQLEENFQANNQSEKPGRCFFCNRLAPVRNGLAI
jgi:hypothetical protein